MFQLKDLISAGLYEKEEDVQKDALRALLWAHPEYRLELAIHTYQEGEISLSKAAYKAGLCFEEMRDILRKRGIRLHLGPESHQEILKEVDILRKKLDGVHRQ